MSINKTTSVKFRVSFNSPVILSFAMICFFVTLLGYITNHMTTYAIFSVYRSSLLSPLTYVRFIGHIFGHSGWSHLMNNMMLLLIVGPMLEEKYGSGNIIIVILATAVITGLASFIFFPHVRLMGSSGVVFAFILLSSFTSIKEGCIPMTFILVALAYLGEQVYNGIFVSDNISNMTHIIGGLVGAWLGYVMHKNKVGKY